MSIFHFSIHFLQQQRVQNEVTKSLVLGALIANSVPLGSSSLFLASALIYLKKENLMPMILDSFKTSVKILDSLTLVSI